MRRQPLLKQSAAKKVIDFGQNMAGYVEITISGKRGDVIELSHAEVLDKDGNFYTKNLRLQSRKIHIY